MSEFNIALKAEQTLPLGDKIRFTIHTSKSKDISENLRFWSGIQTQQVNDNTLQIEMVQKPQFTGVTTQQHMQDSFVIDVSEASTLAFVEGFKASKNEDFKLSSLVAYVDTFIDSPTYVNGFNIASVVATQRSGDCTEYAVLLTALARSLGLPSKVVVGTVIVADENKLNAFGHAWNEVWHQGQWHVLDAALYRSPALQHFYLPASDLLEEGPGYAFGLVKTTVLLPSKITDVHTAD